MATAGANKPVWSNDQIARQLTFDSQTMGREVKFDVSQSRTITVNLSGLAPADQFLARAALQTWSDATGLTFVEAGTAQINFLARDGVNSTSRNVGEDSFIKGSTIFLSPSNLPEESSSFASPNFQTFIHEIGHALGLNHTGQYNGSADYRRDAMFQNDSTHASIMSYFNSDQNPNVAASVLPVITPQVADNIAIRNMYGSTGTTRTDDTIYGYNTNAGAAFDPDSFQNGVAYTIVDDGGKDTLDFSRTGMDQLFDLRAEGSSSLLGYVGNVQIGRGVVIENAIGGSGNDLFIANAAANHIIGDSGVDTVSYIGATSGVVANLTEPQGTKGFAAGDTYSSVEGLIGSAFDDKLFGNSSDNVLTGGKGADRLQGGAGSDTVNYSDSDRGLIVDLTAPKYNTGIAAGDTYKSIENITGSTFDDKLYGNDQNNILTGGAGADRMQGGAGSDTASYADSASGVVVSLRNPSINTGIALGDTYKSIENLTGSSLSDQLFGNDGNNTLSGGLGDDTIDGGRGSDTLVGGAGRDTFLFASGSGHDVITDFNTTRDKISFDNMKDGVYAAADFTFTLVDSGTMISIAGSSDSVFVSGKSLDILKFSDYILLV